MLDLIWAGYAIVSSNSIFGALACINFVKAAIYVQLTASGIVCASKPLSKDPTFGYENKITIRR